jgi:hypothetical protein
MAQKEDQEERIATLEKRYRNYLKRGGLAKFFAIANPQISWVCQAAKPQIFIINPQIANPQISTKILHNFSANRKSAKCHICGMSANLTNYLSQPICGFAICRTYLRTAHIFILTPTVPTVLKRKLGN